MRPIDADKLADIFKTRKEQCRGVYGSLEGAISGVLMLVEMQPTVDAEFLKHGKWVESVFHNGCTFDHDMVCSVCGHSGLPDYKYCPNCGAKMMDESEAEE